MFHILSIRTSNLPNFLIIGISWTQFLSFIYRFSVSIFVPLIRPLCREPCTISMNACIKPHIIWLDNSDGASSIVIFVTCFSTSSFIYRFLISTLLVNRMCLVSGSKTVTMQFLLSLWTVFNLYPQVLQFLLGLHGVIDPL